MNIILADDDTFFQKFYSSQLIARGFDITVAVDGADALLKMEEHKPDLLILDLIMPNKDGFEVLSELQKNPSLSKIPVLVFSTLGQEQDVKRAQDLGAKGYVNKSFFDLEALIAQINKVATS